MVLKVLWRLELRAPQKGKEDATGKAEQLSQQNLLVELRGTHQTADRHCEVAAERFAQCFTKFRDDIGPNGAHVYTTISNGGKTNKNGNRVCSTILPHRNPLLCAIFARGGLRLHKFTTGCCTMQLHAVICL